MTTSTTNDVLLRAHQAGLFDGVRASGIVGIWRTGLLAAATWLLLGLITLRWPNKEVGFSDWAFTDEFGYAAVAVAVLLTALAVAGDRAGRVAQLLRPAGQWLVAAPLLLGVWEILTAKLGVLPTPFFAPPQSLIEVYSEDWRRLGISTGYSLRLLVHGFAAGGLVGFLVGATIGWSRVAGYWVHPVLRFLGPVPASALLPLAFFCAVQLCGGGIPDRAGDRLPGRRADLVGRGFGQQELLRCGPHAGCVRVVSDSARGDSGSIAAGVCGLVHGPGRRVLGAGDSRNDGRQGRSWLVSAMGPGLGRLRQYVCGADCHGNSVLQPDYLVVQGARPRIVVAERNRQMVNASLAQPLAATAATTSQQQTGARIDIEHVSHWFKLPNGVLQVLDDISLSVAPGEFVALLGPSGCGKSTLLRLVAGLEAATTGQVLQDNSKITRPDPSRIVVFQDPTLYPWRKVWDNVALGLQARGLLKQQRQRVDDALALVGLTAFADAFPHQLSGGMAQRVALARALVNDPQLLILDEPLGKLDSLTRLQMQSELVSLWQRNGFSALLVTHDVEEALFLANRVIIFSDRPARIRAEIKVDLPYPRHRGDARLAELRHTALRHLGLDASW